MGKIYKVLVVCLTLLLAGCGTTDKKEDTPNNSKSTTLTIVVYNEDKEIFNDKVTVEGSVKTLADFLEKADELKVEMKDSEYGKTIMSILDITTEDWNAGPWWLYESDTNESCKAAGQCDAANNLEIKNGDSFTFTFKKL